MKTKNRKKHRPHLPPNKVREDKRKKTPKYPIGSHITHSMASDDCPYPDLW